MAGIPAQVFVPALVLLPDLANLIGDNTRAWVVWLTLTQMSMAGLCLFAILAPRTYTTRVVWAAAFMWYMTQALDEALAGNLFVDSALEYVVFLAYTALIGLHLYTHERQRKKP